MTIEERERKKLEDYNKRLNETILLCTEFLLTNLSDIDLSKKTGISSSTVGRRLTKINQEYIIVSYDRVVENLKSAGISEEEIPKTSMELFELIQKKRQENLEKGKALGGQTTFLNHVYVRGDNGEFQGVKKLSLNAIYTDTIKQYKFLINAALCFRLHLDTLSVLFQLEENELLQNMLNHGNYDALTTLFYHDGKDQNVARIEFMNYYREMLEAIRNKNSKEQARLINIISDKNALLLNKRIKEAKENDLSINLSEEDIEVLIRYQLKYYLSARDIAYIFSLDRSNYQRRVTSYLAAYPELKTDYEDLMTWNEYKYRKGRK